MSKTNERLICYIIAFIMFLIGMCLETTKTDSSFLYTDLVHAEAALAPVDYLAENVDSCTSEMIGKNSSISSVRGDLGRSVIRWDRSIMLSVIVGAILQYLLYLRSSSNGEYYEIRHSGTVAVNYIHHKDGEK